jgi:glycine hydroxymethyltransferase
MKDVETGELDYEEMRKLAHEHKPKIILAGFSSYPRELDYQRFAQIAGEVGAMAMADIAHIAGLIAAGELANPLEHGFQVVTTTTHKTLRGPRGGMILTSGQAGNPLKSIDKSLDNLPTLIDRAVFPGLQGGPHMNNILAKTVALQEASTDEFKQYASQTIKNAKRLAGALMNRGFKLVTNGTDNHLVLADVKQSHGIDGKIAEETLDKIGLTLNKNVVPDDKLPPYAPSGIRLGTPAMTTRGLNEDDMERVAEWMKQALEGRQNEPLLADLKRQVVDFSQEFPLPS